LPFVARKGNPWRELQRLPFIARKGNVWRDLQWLPFFVGAGRGARKAEKLGPGTEGNKRKEVMRRIEGCFGVVVRSAEGWRHGRRAL